MSLDGEGRAWVMTTMCGRYGRDVPWAVLRDWLNLLRPTAAPNLQPEMDVRPTTRQWVARPAEDGMELVRMRWGLIPFWFKGSVEKEFKLTTFNAKAETVATAATFKGPFARRRCLVPASNWYEWTGPKGSKEKWAFTRKDGEPLTFAGIWDTCTLGEEKLESFTIVTQPAGAPLNGYHDRAPVVIERDAWSTWLNLTADVTPLLGPESADHFNVASAA